MRKYAPFFEWFDKGRKELGVVEELIAALNQIGQKQFHTPQLCETDPPDCVCLDDSGAMVAIEVSEVVCEDAARENAQGKDVYRVWRPGDITEHIVHRLSEKDGKTFHGGPYSETVICLFTGEPALTLEEAARELETHKFGPFNQITASYLVFSYDSETKTYPVLSLDIVGSV